ncbi:hypothetical protein EON65_28310 [archaeon]|nr:MAG: hypothetical protein EON65_28310 [archaeon]
MHSKGLKFGIYSSAGFKTCQAFPARYVMAYVCVVRVRMCMHTNMYACDVLCLYRT